MNAMTVNTSQKDVVLIIDDNPTNLGVVVESLEESGFKIIVARNGEMGLKRARLVKPDIILLDIIMPGISGFETCSRLKADKNTVDIPVIFMTALDNTEDKVKGFELGGVDYITKPVQVEEVLARLKTHLTIHKLKNVNQQNERLKQEIAKRKLVEEQLRQSKELAESANHAKSAFLANMSHELRTPLNGILGYTQILNRDKSLTEQQQKGIQVIHRSGEHLLTLINDILDLSKIEAGKLELMPTECNLQSFLQYFVDLFEMKAVAKGIKLIYQSLSELPSIANVDQKLLRQVLLNLLSNAIKFTKTGQVTFKVHFQANLISFEIEDSGEGIAAENLEKIFLAFQQVGEQSHHIEGTGLGLSISKKLVKMMGGELHVESEINVGSRFWFAIPLIGCEKEIKNTNAIRSNTEMIKPTAEQIKVLFEIARTGNVRAIIKQAEALLEQQADLKNFVDKVCDLAKSFNISELKKFLQ